MRNITKKLVVFLIVSMLILSEAYSIQVRDRRGRRVLQSSTRNRNNNFTDFVIGFTSGFVFEMSNELNLHDSFQCIIQDVTVTIRNKVIKWKMEDVLKIKENYDEVVMDESSNVNSERKLNSVLDNKLISAQDSSSPDKSFLDKFMGYIEKIPDYIQNSKDSITVLTNSELYKEIQLIMNNDFLMLLFDFTCCILFSGSTSGAKNKSRFEIIINRYFKDIGNIVVIISKIFEVPILFEAFKDNWNRAATDYERFEVLGKAVAGVVKIMLKTAGLSIFKR